MEADRLSPGQYQLQNQFGTLNRTGRMDGSGTISTQYLQKRDASSALTLPNTLPESNVLGSPSPDTTVPSSTEVESSMTTKVQSTTDLSARYQYLGGHVQIFPRGLAEALENHYKAYHNHSSVARRAALLRTHGTVLTTREGRRVIFRCSETRELVKVGYFKNKKTTNETIVVTLPHDDGWEFGLLGSYCGPGFHSRPYVANDGSEWMETYYHIWTQSSDEGAHGRGECEGRRIIRLTEKVDSKNDPEAASSDVENEVQGGKMTSESDNDTIDDPEEPTRRLKELKRLQSHNKPGRREHGLSPLDTRKVLKKQDATQLPTPDSADFRQSPSVTARKARKRRRSERSERTIDSDEDASASIPQATPSEQVRRKTIVIPDDEPAETPSATNIKQESEPTALLPSPTITARSASAKPFTQTTSAEADKENIPPAPSSNLPVPLTAHTFVFKQYSNSPELKRRAYSNCKTVISLFGVAEHFAKMATEDTGVLYMRRANGMSYPVVKGDQEGLDEFFDELKNATIAEEILVLVEA